MRTGILALGWDLHEVPLGWNQNCNFQIKGDRKIASYAKLGGKVLSFKDGVTSNNREMTIRYTRSNTREARWGVTWRRIKAWFGLLLKGERLRTLGKQMMVGRWPSGERRQL